MTHFFFYQFVAFFFLYIPAKADLNNCLPRSCVPTCGGECVYYECIQSKNQDFTIDHIPFEGSVTAEPGCNNGKKFTLNKLPGTIPLDFDFGSTQKIDKIPTKLKTNYNYCVARTERWNKTGWTITYQGPGCSSCACGGSTGDSSVNAYCANSSSSPMGKASGQCCDGANPSRGNSCGGCSNGGACGCSACPPPAPAPAPAPAAK